jgi:hypothetical protein
MKLGVVLFLAHERKVILPVMGIRLKHDFI